MVPLFYYSFQIRTKSKNCEDTKVSVALQDEVKVNFSYIYM